MARIVEDERLAQWFPEASEVDRLMHRDAAEAYVRGRCKLPTTVINGEVVEQIPADLVEAVRLLVARYLARENSPEGFVGMSEFGPARIATVDRDVQSLIAPWRPVVFG